MLRVDSPQESTNVRARMRGLALRALGAVLPGLAARWAEALFFTPPPPPRSRRVPVWPAPARRLEVPVGETTVAAWAWGHGPQVYLVHGWGAEAAHLLPFVGPLLALGHGVVAFDAPGHGASPAPRSSLVSFAEALSAVAQARGPAHAVIGHSLGGAAAVLALRRGLWARRVVLLAAPADPGAWTRSFAGGLGLGSEVSERLRERATARLGLSADERSVPAAAAGLRARALVVHDREDREVPFADAATICAAWPGAALHATRGLGHRRLVREPEVVAEAVSFVTGAPRAVTRALCGGCPRCARPAAGSGGLCETCTIELDLFDPRPRRARMRAAAAALPRAWTPV